MRLAFTVFLLTCISASACSEWKPFDMLIQDSSIIVIGEITNKQDVQIGEIENPFYVVESQLKIEEILKNEKGLEVGEEVTVTFASEKNRYRISTDWYVNVGERGIWLLRAEEHDGRLYPDRRFFEKERDRVEAIVSRKRPRRFDWSLAHSLKRSDIHISRIENHSIEEFLELLPELMVEYSSDGGENFRSLVVRCPDEFKGMDKSVFCTPVKGVSMYDYFEGIGERTSTVVEYLKNEIVFTPKSEIEPAAVDNSE